MIVYWTQYNYLISMKDKYLLIVLFEGEQKESNKQNQ